MVSGSRTVTVESDVTFSASGTADVAVVAGVANSSTIENVQVTGKITSTGASVSGKRFAIGGIAGFAFSTVSGTEGVLDCNIKNCTVTATVNADGGKNLANGANGAMYGGIAGFCTNAKNDSRIRITNCVNNGTLTVKLGRCSGIAATANYGTIIKGCTNNASQFNTVENGRIGQIVCNLSAQSGVIDCQNNGDLTTTDAKTTTGGLIALMGDATSYLEGGDRVANTATISSPTIDKRVCCKVVSLPSFHLKRALIFVYTSRTRIVAAPKESPLPQPIILISNVPNIIPPNQSGRWLRINWGNACAE